MPHHADKSPSALAHGPAKGEDIERARRELRAAEARGARAPLAERAYLSELQRTLEGRHPGSRVRGRLSRGTSAPGT
jgi:hypothetical protein